LPENGSYLVVSYKYRRDLSVAVGAEVSLDISKAGVLARLARAYDQHPDSAIRLAIRLGVLSVVLGVYGLLPYLSRFVDYVTRP
jgi:hypothetical protein